MSDGAVDVAEASQEPFGGTSGALGDDIGDRFGDANGTNQVAKRKSLFTVVADTPDI